MPDNTKTGDRLSRRKLLALTLSGTAVGLAGCSGGGNNNTTSSGAGASTQASNTATSTRSSGGGTPTSASGNSTGSTTSASGSTTAGNETSQNGTQSEVSADQMADSVVDLLTGFIPKNANWNHNSNGPYMSFLPYDYTFNTYWNGSTHWWLLKEDGFNYDSDALTLTFDFREDYGYWWNGDPVTAEDYLVMCEIERLQDPEGSPWKSWELQDKYTITGTRKENLNPAFLSSNSNGYESRLMEYRGAWRKWLEKFQDATTDDARKSILKNMTEWKISTEDFAKKGLGNGTYRPTDWSTTEMVWEKFDKHPYADQAPFPKIRFHVAEGSAKNQMITHDKIDINGGKFPDELRQPTPDYLKSIYERRSIQSRNLLFDYNGDNGKHMGRRNVRRALVSILDFTQLVDFWNGKGGPVKQRQTGLPKALEEKWLGDDLVNQMVDYPLKRDEQQAKKFMKKAGYKKKDGRWIDSDGDPLKFTFLIGSFGTMAALGKAINQAWNQWGAKATLLPVTNSQWNDKVFTPTGDWDVTVFLHGWDRLDALNFFDTVNPYHMRLGPSFSKIAEWLKADKTHSPVNGKPLKLTIPSSPSLEVGDDGGEQINIYKLVEELKTTQSEKRSHQIIQTISRYFNYDLPMFDMFPQVGSIWGDTKHFDWPKNADVWYQKGSRAMDDTLRTGVLRPVSKNQ